MTKAGRLTDRCVVQPGTCAPRCFPVSPASAPLATKTSRAAAAVLCNSLIIPFTWGRDGQPAMQIWGGGCYRRAEIAIPRVLACFAGRRRLARSVPTVMLPVNPSASAAFLKSAAVSAPPGTLSHAQACRRARINSVATLRCHPHARPNVNDGSPQRQRSRGQCAPVLGLRSFRSPFPRASVSGGALRSMT